MTVLGFMVAALLAFGLGFWLTKRLQGEQRQRIGSATSTALTAPSDLDDQVQQLLAQDKIIDAIKLVRARTGWPLTTSKAYVDRLRQL